MSLSLSVCSQRGPPICTLFWAFFRAFKALRALLGPQIEIVSRSTKPEIFMSLSLSVLSQSGPPKSVGGGGGSGVGGGGGRIPHFNWSIYRGGNFFFFFLNPG